MTRRQKYFDLQCGEVREGLSAMLDGEADASESEALLTHLETCHECAAYYDELHTLDVRLCKELTDSCDPDQIWERVQWAVAAQDTAPTEKVAAGCKTSRVPAVPRWVGSALAAMLLLAVIAGGLQMWRPDVSNLPVVTETVRDFETFRLRGELLDVAAAEPKVVRRWMAAKVDFKLPENVDPPTGFKIAGGRLCSFLNRRLAFFLYENGPAVLSLYVMKASGLKLPDSGSFDTTRSEQGLSTVTWKQGGLAYVVVSDLPAPEVTSFASHLMGREAESGEANL